MAKFCVEFTKAYLVDASDEEDAFEVFMALSPEEAETAHDATGNFTEVTAVYESEEQDVVEDDTPFNHEENV